MGIHPMRKPATPSTMEQKPKTTQYVSHCVSTVGLPESIALKDIYAGYTNETKSVTSFAPPTRYRNELKAVHMRRKK